MSRTLFGRAVFPRVSRACRSAWKIPKIRLPTSNKRSRDVDRIYVHPWYSAAISLRSERVGGFRMDSRLRIVSGYVAFPLLISAEPRGAGQADLPENTLSAARRRHRADGR